MNIRNLTHTDVEAMWAINEDGLPGTGQVSQVELVALLDLASLSLGCLLYTSDAADEGLV